MSYCCYYRCKELEQEVAKKESDIAQISELFKKETALRKKYKNDLEDLKGFFFLFICILLDVLIVELSVEQFECMLVAVPWPVMRLKKAARMWWRSKTTPVSRYFLEYKKMRDA
jgi:hypothetical protein